MIGLQGSALDCEGDRSVKIIRGDVQARPTGEMSWPCPADTTASGACGGEVPSDLAATVVVEALGDELRPGEAPRTPQQGSGDINRVPAGNAHLSRSRAVAGARLLLICGLPGAGKTTLAKRLAPEVSAVRLCPDEWKHDLGLDYYDDEGRIRAGSARLWRLGQELLELGQSVILENGYFGGGEGHDSCRLQRHGARGLAVELHYLEAPVDELWRRLEVRNGQAPPGHGADRA